MKLFGSIISWLDNHNNVAYSLVRIFLGAALFVRGIILASDPENLTKLAGSNQFYWYYSYIIVVHLIGGFLLTTGFITRLAAFLQIPVLFGAVFFLHFQKGLATAEQSLELSALVLVLLVVYFLFGSGILSIDDYLTKRKSSKKKKINS